MARLPSRGRWRPGRPSTMALAVLVSGLIPLFVVGLIGYRTASHALRSDTRARLANAAEATSTALDRLMFERFGDVQAFSRGKRAQSMQPAALTTLMHTLLRSYRPLYASTVVADPQ